VANRTSGEPDRLAKRIEAVGAGQTVPQRNQAAAGHQSQDGEPESLTLSGSLNLGCSLICGLFAVLLVVGGAILGAKAGASLAGGGVLAYALGSIGAIIGVAIVGLFVVFVVFPIWVMDSYDDSPSKRIKDLKDILRRTPDDPRVLLSLGDALTLVRRREEGLEVYKKVLRLGAEDPKVYVDLGNTLHHIRRPDEAIQAYREALRLNSQLPDAHFRLGLVLRENGRLDEAIAEFREVIHLRSDDTYTNYHLGMALRDTGRFEEAIAAFRKLPRIDPDSPWFDSDYNAALPETELMAQAAERLPAVLEGKELPADAPTCLVFAQLCQLAYLKRYAAAARFFDDAFAKQPELAEDRRERRRYRAASLAVRAACGQGGDADGLDDNERARLHRQARDWLQADLKAWGRVLDTAPANASAKVSVGNDIRLTLHPWLDDPDIACVRRPEALAALPEAERQAWQELWGEVGATLKRGEKTLNHWVGR
jgi:tetratricopeptide (TPR) repeat protein